MISPPQLGELTRRWLASPRLLVVAPLLAVLLCAPSLGNGLDLDDVLQAARLTTRPTGPADLFQLFGGPDPLFADADAPWWRHPHMTLALLRPVAALTHLLDHRLFAGHPGLMHLHSLLWYALLVGAAGALYRRLIPLPWAAGAALLLFAVDHSHGMVVGWLSARNGLIGAGLAMLALLAHLRWRATNWRPGALLAPALLLLALLASEGAIAIFGFFLAHAICSERGPWRARLLSLLPAVAVILAWRLAYTAAGFGAAHTGFYFDPAADPLAFAARTLQHGVLLVCSQIAVSLGEALGLAPGLYLPGAAIATILLAGLALLLRRDLRRSPALRFWALGTLLCALPLGSTLPTDRQLLLIGFGVFGFAAQLCSEPRERPTPRGARWLARLWWIVHAVLSPLLLPLRSLASHQLHALATTAAAAYIPAAAPPCVILLRAPSDLVMLYARAEWTLHARPFPRELRYLYAGLGAWTVTRLDDRTLELRPEPGWLYAPLDHLFRDPHDPLPAVIDLGSMRVDIVERTADGRPQAARFRFDRPLDHPDLAFFSWEQGGPVPFVLPAIGAARTVPAITNPMLAP